MNAPQNLSPNLSALVEALPKEPAAASVAAFPRPRQVEFLHALAESGAVRRASAAIGISYRTVYRERRSNAAFRRAWDAALLSARALSEDVLATRAIDGVEEVVWFRGEEVGRRIRYDSRLLLAHLARLDRLTEDARTRAFAEDLDGALERFAAGIDDPAPVCTECGDPFAPSPEGPPGEGGALPPGQCDRCDTPPAPPAPAVNAKPPKPPKPAIANPCPDCGGRCLDEEAVLTKKDCMWLGNRLARMDAARPAGAKVPGSFAGYGMGEVEAEQLDALDAGAERWWLVVPPDEDDDPEEWCYANE